MDHAHVQRLIQHSRLCKNACLTSYCHSPRSRCATIASTIRNDGSLTTVANTLNTLMPIFCVLPSATSRALNFFGRYRHWTLRGLQ